MALSLQDILTSIQCQQLIKDEFIRSGSYEKTSTGMPIRYSGGFTIVVPFIVGGEKWAFRCWHSDLGNVRERFRKLSEALRDNQLPYFVDFEYVDEGLMVNGKVFPTSRMRWVDGINIKDYVCQHRNEKEKLLQLAMSFKEMCETMHKAKYSHGDLQHGNIMVDSSGRLFLIDYDSLYHTSMGQMYDIVKGLSDYQHPRRKETTYASEKVDYFSEMVIYTSIRAVAEKPTLVDKYQLEAADNMLFQASDYSDFLNAGIYHELWELGTDFQCLLGILEEYLTKMSIEDLMPLEIMIDSYMGEPGINEFRVHPDSAIYEGDTIRLLWETEHCNKLSLNNISLNPSEKSYELTVSGDKSFTLKASNTIKSVSQRLSIKAYKRPVVKFEADKDKVRKGRGECFHLRWDVQHAKGVTIIDHNQTVLSDADKGEIELTISDDSDYTIRVTGLDGVREFEENRQVAVVQPSEVLFSVDKHFSFPSVPIRVDWHVEYAKRVWLEGPFAKKLVEHSSQLFFEPEQDVNITLSVEDDFGIEEHKETVRMLPLPLLKCYAPMPEINHSVNIQVAINRPQFKLSMPTSLNLRTVPFVPKANIPNITPNLKITYPNFSKLVNVDQRKGIKYWDSLVSLSNQLYSALINKINTHEK